MFWKKFGQGLSANKLFRQANEHWRQRQHLLLQGDDESARQSCLEVIRLCQLSLQNDKRMGDAYVLLANALLATASELSGRINPDQHDFLHSRGVAVIHFWHSLPHKGYPITKNVTIGDQLWQMTLGRIMQENALHEKEAIELMHSYRDSLAANAVSPDCYQEIQTTVLGDIPLPGGKQINRSAQAGRNVKAVLYAYKNKDWRPLAEEVVDTVVEIGGAAVEPLIQALRDEDDDIRWLAAMSLGRIEDPRAVEPLIEALKDTDKSVRKEAARSLGYMEDARAVEPLIASLRDTDSLVRREAALTLRELGDSRAVEPLIELLKDTDEYVRRGPASSLGKIGDPRAVEPLIRALRDESENVRSLAAMSLREIGDIRAVEPLIEALSDTDSGVRQQAVWSLGALGDARAVEPLIQALSDTSDNVRKEAIRSLGKLGDAKAIEPLTIFLTDKDKYIRQEATQSIYYIEKRET